jgi:hypothetical protein
MAAAAVRSLIELYEKVYAVARFVSKRVGNKHQTWYGLGKEVWQVAM